MPWKEHTTKCKQCGKTFTGRFGPNRQFCSVACRQAYRNAPERNPAKAPEARAKLAEAARGNTRCVGRVLSDDTKEKIAAALRGRKLSVAHKRAIGRAHKRLGTRPPRNTHLRGPRHPHWKGGHSKERQARYGAPEYRAFVAAVLERDAYTCQHCGAHNGQGENVVLQVHHVKPYADYPALAYDVNNGLSLCIHCHRHAHAGMPRPSDPNYHGKVRICQICGREFRIKNGRKYCPECREMYCCPVCGSTTCSHNARRLLQQAELFEF